MTHPFLALTDEDREEMLLTIGVTSVDELFRDIPATVGQPHHPGTQAQQDDADILDAVIREEPLEIVLHERIQNAEQRGQRSNHEQRATPPGGSAAREETVR